MPNLFNQNLFWNKFFFSSMALLIVVVAVLVPVATSIRCWDCNSLINKGCDDPFKPDDFEMADCSQKHLARFPDKEGNICRKTIQKINDQYRIIRGCGYINDTFDTIPPGVELDTECIRRTGTFSVMIEYCACNSKDGCNHSSRMTPTSFLSFFIPVFITIIIVALKSDSLFDR